MGRLRFALTVMLALAAGITAAPATEPYDIDVILPLTGAGAFLGKTQQQSLEILQGVLNQEGGIDGRQVRFLFADDQSTPQVAVQVASRIIAKHPAVLIGPSLVATCNAVMPLVRNGPVTYCLTPGAYPPPGGFVFTAQPATRANMEALLRFFATRGWTRLAFLNSSDATGRDAEKDFDSVLQMPGNQDMRVVAREHFNPADLEVGAQIQIIRQANPQVLLAWTTGAPVATVFKAAVNAGLNIPVVTTNGNQTYEQMRQYASFLPKELYLPSTEWPAGPQGLHLSPDVAAAQTRYGRALANAGARADSSMSLPWDPVSIIVDAVRHLGPNTTALSLRDALATWHTAGIAGTYDFTIVPQRGLGASSVVITRWDEAAQLWRVVSRPGGYPLEAGAGG